MWQIHRIIHVYCALQQCHVVKLSENSWMIIKNENNNFTCNYYSKLANLFSPEYAVQLVIYLVMTTLHLKHMEPYQ